MATAQLSALLERLDQRMRLVEDELIPDDERIGTDVIRDKADLELCMKFSLEVYHEGKTESVWAAEHPREYERLQRIAGTVPVMKRAEV